MGQVGVATVFAVIALIVVPLTSMTFARFVVHPERHHTHRLPPCLSTLSKKLRLAPQGDLRTACFWNLRVFDIPVWTTSVQWSVAQSAMHFHNSPTFRKVCCI